jgi:hypothetical protein
MAVDKSVTQLVLYDEYSRKEVHDIFSPDTIFTPGAGTWGLQGVIPLPDRPGDWVFFVTFGQSQGEHKFDEVITEDGVLTWQSQPAQALNDRMSNNGFIITILRIPFIYFLEQVPAGSTHILVA